VSDVSVITGAIDVTVRNEVLITNAVVGGVDSFGEALFHTYVPRQPRSLFAAQVLAENFFSLAQACGGDALVGLDEGRGIFIDGAFFPLGSWVVVDKTGKLCKMDEDEFENDFRRAGKR
jgi:hypothetical protein